jgi:hypothetical protein
VIVGLGSDAIAKSVVILWPSGIIQTLADIKGDRMLNVMEPAR